MMSSADFDSLYHVCRWCKWFSGGKCFNGAFAQASSGSQGVYQVAEDGRLSGVIEETLGSIKPEEIEEAITLKLTGFKLSDKRIEGVLNTLKEALGEFLEITCRDKLDEAISTLYQEDAESRGNTSEGVEITDPHTFYCKEFF